MHNKDYCMSHYLAFRYIVNRNMGWSDSLVPEYPENVDEGQIPVKTSDEIRSFIESYVREMNVKDTGILLSGGIDSAIIASYLPKGAKAYTIRFIAKGAVDETILAAQYATYYNLEHIIVDVTWEDYVTYSNVLMKRKKSPLHAVEVALYKAALRAKEDGITHLLLGNGADSTFGGMDKLLSKDWTFDEFVKRYTFIDPQKVLRTPYSVIDQYEPYRLHDKIDVISFLKTLHGIGIIQAFDNAIKAAGCIPIAPYEKMYLDCPLDINRIRQGESKYLLRDIFTQQFKGLTIPNKIPFARPMDVWLKTWKGPDRKEFCINNIHDFTGDQKWLLYCLEQFLILNNL